jgi:hypothetical protein
MKVKGTAVRVLSDYIKRYYPDLYQTWLDSLPEKSYKIFSKTIFASEWFDLYESHVAPTIVLADLLNEQPEIMAKKVGHFSAETALKSIYSIFLKIASLRYSIHRVPQFFSTYYQPVFVEIVSYKDGETIIKFGHTKENENLLYYRNAGWMEKFLELAFKPVNLQVVVNIKPEETKPDYYYAIFHVTWEK